MTNGDTETAPCNIEACPLECTGAPSYDGAQYAAWDCVAEGTAHAGMCAGTCIGDSSATSATCTNGTYSADTDCVAGEPWYSFDLQVRVAAHMSGYHCIVRLVKVQQVRRLSSACLVRYSHWCGVLPGDSTKHVLLAAPQLLSQIVQFDIALSHPEEFTRCCHCCSCCCLYCSLPQCASCREQR